MQILPAVIGCIDQLITILTIQRNWNYLPEVCGLFLYVMESLLCFKFIQLVILFKNIHSMIVMRYSSEHYHQQAAPLQ